MPLNYCKLLQPIDPIAGALTYISDPISLGPESAHVNVISAQSTFLYGSGGTTVKVFIQTSLDNGASWMDIICLAFTTAALKKVGAVSLSVVAAVTTPTDGTLADNTVVNGILGDRLRVKTITAGTYAGLTSLQTWVTLR